jgi:arginine deiminase
LEVSSREHARLKAVLERFATVHEISDLLTEVLARPEAREYLISRTMDVVPSEPLAQQLSRLPPRAIVKMLIEGTEEEPGPIATALNETGFVLPPLPISSFPGTSAWWWGATPWWGRCATEFAGPKSC